MSSAGRDLSDIPRCPRRDPSCHVERFLLDSSAERAFLLVSGAIEIGFGFRCYGLVTVHIFAHNKVRMLY